MPSINETSSADPMTAAFKILIAGLKASNAFYAGSNRAVRRFTDWSDGNTTKPLQSESPNDVPDITLVQGAFTLNPEGGNSVIAEIMQTYTLVSVSDSLQVAQANAVKWAFMGAIHNLQLEKCQWKGTNFIRGYQITNGQDGTTGVQLPGLTGTAARGVDRIVSIVAIQLLMAFDRNSLPS